MNNKNKYPSLCNFFIETQDKFIESISREIKKLIQRLTYEPHNGIRMIVPKTMQLRWK